ncbi:hypothetical protein [Nocardioides bruguierae]|uniref:Uncharacterized protein n=1 Tax=Nocardioides bruguierae TaxID=2945102 RepID=A0A9X2DAA8_9ACTN|nr:hypothetical protein [Nocardioides bruguierae]MCM0622188.1 hypothetical protein [Nocardioides bruguierae]
MAEPNAETEQFVEAIAWGRAPRYPSRNVNYPVVCADGFTVSVQASSWHYANDSHPSGRAAYWRTCTDDEQVVYPFTTFEVGYPTDTLPDSWEEYGGGGVWAWVPREKVAELLALHGGAVAWNSPSDGPGSEADRG